MWNWNIQGSAGGHLENQRFLTKKTKKAIIMIYASISIVFDPLNPMQPSILP